MAEVIAAAWVCSGALSYGILYAFFQRQYPSIADEHQTSDRVLSFVVAITGPIGLVAALIAMPIIGGYGPGLRLRHGLLYR